MVDCTSKYDGMPLLGAVLQGHLYFFRGTVLYSTCTGKAEENKSLGYFVLQKLASHMTHDSG